MTTPAYYARNVNRRRRRDGKMGHTKQLSDAEKDDLVRYLESIGPSRPDGLRPGGTALAQPPRTDAK